MNTEEFATFLGIPSDLLEELLPFIKELGKLQTNATAVAWKFKPDGLYFIPTMLKEPQELCTGTARFNQVISELDYLFNRINLASHGELPSKKELPIAEQIKFVIDFDFDTVRNSLCDIIKAVEVGSYADLIKQQEEFRNEAMKEFPFLLKNK